MRPREKLEERGIANLSDLDLVSALVSVGSKDRDYVKLSRDIVKLLRDFVEDKEDICIQELCDIKGVGIAKASKIVAGIELGRRLYGHFDDNFQVRTSEDVYHKVGEIVNKRQEYLVGLFVNARYEFLGKRVIGVGTLDRLSILPRDVIIPALELNSAGVVLVHNHPSGDVTPSKADLDLTERIEKALELVGLKLIDHVIVAKKGWKSIV